VPDDPYAPLAEHGIRRISIPTPFAVGRVNLYLIEDDPLTLVDAGPNSGTSLDELDQQLRALGRSIPEIERIVITHQHIDHIGLVKIVAARSGAEVVALDRLAPFVENYSAEAAADDAYAATVMLRHGIPEDVAHALQSVSLAFRAWGSGSRVAHTVRDGGTLGFGSRSFEVHFRPGHSPTDTVFLDAERGILIGGDHLLATISSNPLISRPPGRKALIEYMDSLGQTRAMDLDVVLPGHGDPVDDHRALIDARMRLHGRRADKIHGLIAERPRSAYEVAQAMWGNVAVTQAFLTLSEVLGHTDVLIRDGRVAEEQDGAGHVVFRATSA
jgi:glyoxylase-like metal-dependent hydrolase (beta-lactamase superfamily II)